MGVRGAFTTLRKTFDPIDPLKIDPQKIGIDVFSLVYTHRANLDDLVSLIKSWSNHGHIVTCIWDGSAPKEKKEIIEQRRDQRDSATENKNGLEEYLKNFGSELNENDIKQLNTAISYLSWKGWHLSGSLKRQIKESLGESISHIYAPGEADDLLINMIMEGTIDIVVSLDSDMLAMGSPRIWRLLRIRKEWVVEDISVEKICTAWNISLGTLQDTCFLAGWDRCHLDGRNFMAFDSALSRMKHYENLATVVDKFIPEVNIDPDAYERLRIIKKESKMQWIKMIKGK